MQKFLCMIGIHSYKTIECTSCFTTSYKDRPSWSPTRHMVWYQQCSCCGKRRLKDTVKQDAIYTTRHNGVEYARVAWVEYGRMYLGDGQEVKPKPPTPLKPKLKVVDGGKNE